ncbi:centrosomal protein of 162 kDa isoform X5 [Pungitius pungitius]|uniref:centrosomal protein of 162 kDa isoform X5 n=2 Tax=Pungitius pungitius TaxID=134920 RepID=UPI002E10A30A
MSHRLTKEELDEQFDLFLKESVSDDSDKQPGPKSSCKSTQEAAAPWWQEDQRSGRATGREMAKSRFIKTERSQHENDNDTVMGPAANTTAIGLDTIEEEQEKARFFAQLEAATWSNLDYSILNRELDLTCSTPPANLRVVKEVVKQSDDKKKAEVTASTGFPHYSEDFKEENKGEELLGKKSKISPILAKVSLHDSLDDMGEGNGGKDTAGFPDRDGHHHQHQSMEGMGTIEGPMSPYSAPQHATGSVQPASTNDSELPTAEELMRPIRPEKDIIRGFTLQPVSTGGLDDEPHLLERTSPNVTSQKSQPKRAAEAGPVAGTQGTRGLTSPPCSSPDPPNLMWSSRQEIEKLMQEQNKCSFSTSSRAGKAKKQQAALESNASHRRLDGRTTGPSSSSKPNGTAASAKTQPSAFRSLQNSREKAKSTKSQEKADHTEAGLKVSGELVASVQALVAVLQQQIDSSSQQDAPHAQVVPRATHDFMMHVMSDLQREEGGSLVQELRLQLAHKERELQVMKEGAEEIKTLRQQNYHLQSKLQSAEKASQNKRWVEATDVAPEEQLQQIDKEIKEQETLIKGYQQENEKLYLQMTVQQAKSKANEEAMFSENHRLLSELAFTREQLHKTSKTVGSMCLVDHTQRIADLSAQLNTFQRNEAKLSEDFHRVQQEKQALEVELQLMKKERDLAKAQTLSASVDTTVEMHMLEEKHREEVVALKKKLQWFAENQELLDRDARRLNDAMAAIHQLEEQVERLKGDVDKRGSEQQRKSKEKTVDTKRIQDLQRQVKDLEQILRCRNPNSLPALIYAAAAAGCQEDLAAKTSPPPSRVTALLERRIQRLEAELKGHNEEAKHGLRAMEQQFNMIKLRYEQQIANLEQQLKRKQRMETLGPNERRRSQAGPVKEELQRVEESHRQRERSLQQQLTLAVGTEAAQAQSSPGRHPHQDHASKTRTVLCRTVVRLQKERRNVMSVPIPQAETRPTEIKRRDRSAKTLRCTGVGGEETFPTAHCEKTYQPSFFTGSHISEVVQENEALRQHVEWLQLQSEQEKEALRADYERAKEELCRLAGHSAEQLTSIRAEHLRVLDQLHASHALEHSSSKVADLANKLSVQEITVKHLQDQLKEMQGVKEALVISRTREEALQKQLTGLLKELKEAKEAQTPEVKLLCGLERKIVNMERRHQHREKELQQVIVGSLQTLETDQQSEVECWKRLAQDKSRELEAFHLELDSILDILRHLQRQGVVLPHS